MQKLPPRNSFSPPRRLIGDGGPPPNGVAQAKPVAPYRDPAMVGSNYDRLPNEGYMTIDADWIIPALLKGVPIEGRILEPCAGRGHMVYALRQAGLVVIARDLFAYPDPLVADIESGCDLLDISTLTGFDWVITNLPFKDQDEFLAHLLRLATEAGCGVAVLTRLEWTSAQARRFLVHDHPNFAGNVLLTRRPRWSEDEKAAPRHNFSWSVWQPGPRPASQPPWLKFGDGPRTLAGLPTGRRLPTSRSATRLRRERPECQGPSLGPGVEE